MTVFRFHDRGEAGRTLAMALSDYAGQGDVVVLALPRGGVPVAHEVARALSLPMDIWLVRKLGVPGHEELAMGAISTGGVRYLNLDIVESCGASEEQIEKTTERETGELQRRNALYRGGKPAVSVKGKTVILVDDGIATGATMRAAVESLRQVGAEKIVLAAPVGAPSSCEELRVVADDVVCLHTPEPFYGVGQWYESFPQVSDEEVRRIG